MASSLADLRKSYFGTSDAEYAALQAAVALGLTASAVMGSVPRPMQSGRYYKPVPNYAGGWTTNNTLGVGTLRLTPFFNPVPLSIVRLGAEVTAIGDIGSKLRLGMYLDDGTFRPGQLLLDGGQIAGDSATVQELIIAATLPAGWIWVGGAVQAVTVTQPTVRCQNTAGQNVDFGTAIPATNGVSSGRQMAGVTGALPQTFVDSGTPSGSAPSVFLKVA